MRDLNDITVLSATFNIHYLTLNMLKSLFAIDDFPNVLILDNSTKNKFADSNEIIKVLDNRNYKNTLNYNCPSKNHCSSIEFAFSQINTKYVLLCDNDVIFKERINELLDQYKEYDVIGEIGSDVIKGKRLFPYFCIINLDFIKQNNIHYFDEKICMKNNRNDTGASFLKELKPYKPKIKRIKLKDYIVHIKGGTLKQEFIKRV